MVPDARFGVRTLAEVVLAPAAADAVPPSAEELRTLVRDRLGAAAVPREVRVLPPQDDGAEEPGPDGPGPSGLSSPGR